MNVEQFVRKSFPVEGVRVTADNFAEVAKWCDGTLYSDPEDPDNPNPELDPRYIKVRVHLPASERQTKAFVGDWVLYAGKGYKVYTNNGMERSFAKKSNNVFEENQGDPNKNFRDLVHGNNSNPGGSRHAK